MNYLRTRTLVLLAGLAMAGTATAEDNLWFGVKAGTLGLGAEATWRPIDWVDLRLGANLYDLSDSGREAGVGYNSDFNLETYYLTGNLRFPLSPLRLTVGAFQNSNRIDLVSTDATSFDIGGTTFTPADVGTLTSTTSFSSTSPYFGLGFDFELVNRLGLTLDLGVLWQGEPDVTLTADGLLSSDATFLSLLEAERQELANEMDDLKAYPVISLGVNFNFF
ncbi:MAG: hypothetical protein KJO31_06660 [Gammaproteobacteria bacterium]|nr:hypothetical protein [Gammaproteobacteria bacterium]